MEERAFFRPPIAVQRGLLEENGGDTAPLAELLEQVREPRPEPRVVRRRADRFLEEARGLGGLGELLLEDRRGLGESATAEFAREPEHSHRTSPNPVPPMG